MNIKNSFLTAAITTSLIACGSGGESSSPSTAVGQFKDSNTGGLSYKSGSLRGVTDADGSFTYEIGNTVTFFIGGVVIGDAVGKSLITPVDLVAGGSTNSKQVQNIVRFLMMLDEDGDETNGISISPDVRLAADSWTPVDFTTNDLASELMAITADTIVADGGTHILATASDAQNHLESTLLCSYSGAFKGGYIGGDKGNFGFLLDASSGYVTGVAFSTQFNEYYLLESRAPISYNQDMAFISGVSSSGATFRGQFGSPDKISGTWDNYPYLGGFSGERIGGSSDSVYRFTGEYAGGDLGLITFDIDTSNQVSGIAYSAIGDVVFTLTGTLSGTSLSVTASDGTIVTGILDTSTGVSSGSWTDTADSLSGSFTARGCKLN